MALGAVDGSTALGFAMQVHVTGAMRDSDAFPTPLRERLYRAIVEDGALLNNAATEEGGGSPARGAVPGTTALDRTRTARGGSPGRRPGRRGCRTCPTRSSPRRSGRRSTDGGRHVPRRARGRRRRSAARGSRHWGCAARHPAASSWTKRRGSSSSRAAAAGSGSARRRRRSAWFGIAIAATYLGVGEGARDDVVRWAKDRRPGDGSTAVADIPSVQLRLGRLDAELRAARIVVLDVARVAGTRAATRGRRARQAGRHAGGRQRHRRGAPDRRRPGVPRRTPRARVPRRPGRAHQPAPRGRRLPGASRGPSSSESPTG